MATAGGSGKPSTLFPGVPGWQGVARDPSATIAALSRLADARRGSADSDSNRPLPAGYSYLAQLVIHDLTFTRTERPIGAERATGVDNIRSPRLDLDCIYGDGWRIDSHLFRRDTADPTGRCLFRLGTAAAINGQTAGRGSDFARIGDDNDTGSGLLDPLVADIRNDVHLILSQLTLLFMQLHNRVAELAMAGRLNLAGARSPERAFEIAREFVVLTYRGIVFRDLLPRLLEGDVLEHCRAASRDRRSRSAVPPGWLADELPNEFALAGARAGHALTRNTYEVNDRHRLAPIRELARFSSLSSAPMLPVPADWVVEWHNLFEIGHRPPQQARPFTPFYCPDFVDRGFDIQFDLADETLLAGRRHSLSFLDLYRCYRNVPTGQDCASELARELPEARALSEVEMRPDGLAHGQNSVQERALRNALSDHPTLLSATPLSYYILQEALVRHGGVRLGALGSFIVAETAVRALERSRLEEPPRPDPLAGSLPPVASMAAMIRLISGNSMALIEAVETTLKQPAA